MTAMQGIALEAHGTARSVNMATLRYEAWRYTDGQSVLEGLSIGNGQTIRFADTLKVEKFTKDTLMVSEGGAVRIFGRMAEE